MELEKKTTQSLSEQQENFLEVENTCCLCGTELQFEHLQDDSTLKMNEKAHCPCCKIQLKEKEFIIH